MTPKSGGSFASVAANRQISSNVLRFVLEKADGVPLFAEELAKALVEGGTPVRGSDRASEPPESLPESAVPSTLSGLLMARLDRLGRALQTAQLAAALGREFRMNVLSAVSAADSHVVSNDVQELVLAGLVYPAGGSGNAYAFKHALIRDAAYDLASAPARQSAHARIAATLERQFHDVMETQPGLLAYHYAAADQKALAIRFGQRAAEQALQRSAFTEASAHAQSAISWANVLEGSNRAEAELAASAVLSQVHMATRGWADADVKAAVDSCTSLLRKVDTSSPHRVPTLWQLFAYHHTSSDRRSARAVAEELVAVAETSGDRGLRAAAATVLGITLHPEGHITEAKRSLKRAIELYDPELDRDQGNRMGMHPLVLARTLLAQLEWLRGTPRWPRRWWRARSIGHAKWDTSRRSRWAFSMAVWFTSTRTTRRRRRP